MGKVKRLLTGVCWIALILLFTSVNGNEDVADRRYLTNKSQPASLDFASKLKRKAKGEENSLSQQLTGRSSTSRLPKQVILQHSIENASLKMDEEDPSLPQFLIEPQDRFVVRASPARLQCLVTSASDAYFKCNGKWISAEESEILRETDLGTGQPLLRVTINITRHQLDIFFSHHPYTCQCVAWSRAGQVKSKKVIVRTAYLRKAFQLEPVGGDVVVGNEFQLRCEPPEGEPKPTIEWMKDDVMLDPENDPKYFVTQDGALIIRATSTSASGNFTCIAKNVASKRKSHTAVVRVGVNGGWSEWSTWSGCGKKCGIGEGRRLRTCTQPPPQNGGAPCRGGPIQTRTCSNICPVDGGWTEWSSWSTCSPECVHRRRRTCSRPTPHNNGLVCPGNPIENRNCSGGLCAEQRSLVALSDNQNIVLYSCLFVALALLLLIVITTLVVLKRRRDSYSRTIFSSYLPGRRSYTPPSAQADFQIIPTKPPPHPPLYSHNQPSQLRNAHKEPSVEQQVMHDYSLQGRMHARPTEYSRTSAQKTLCSRDDLGHVCSDVMSCTRLSQIQPHLPAIVQDCRHADDVMNYRASCNRSPSQDDVLPSSGCTCKKHFPSTTHVTFEQRTATHCHEYDSGFEGEHYSSYPPVVRAQFLEQSWRRAVNWRNSSDSSDAGYSGCDAAVTDAELVATVGCAQPAMEIADQSKQLESTQT